MSIGLLHLSKGGVLVITESAWREATAFAGSVVIPKGAVLAIVPDSSTTEERIAAVERLRANQPGPRFPWFG